MAKRKKISRKKIAKKPKEKIEKQVKEIHFFTEEFQYRPKGFFWLLTTFIVALALLDFFFLLQQYLAMAVVILAAVVFLQHAMQKPRKSFCKITSDGIEFNNRFFPYSNFKSFWISQSLPNKLYLAQTKKLLPPLTILIGNTSETAMSEFLAQYLPKQKTISEDFADRLAGILKF